MQVLLVLLALQPPILRFPNILVRSGGIYDLTWNTWSLGHLLLRAVQVCALFRCLFTTNLLFVFRVSALGSGLFDYLVLQKKITRYQSAYEPYITCRKDGPPSLRGVGTWKRGWRMSHLITDCFHATNLRSFRLTAQIPSQDFKEEACLRYATWYWFSLHILILTRIRFLSYLTTSSAMGDKDANNHFKLQGSDGAFWRWSRRSLGSLSPSATLTFLFIIHWQVRREVCNYESWSWCDHFA